MQKIINSKYIFAYEEGGEEWSVPTAFMRELSNNVKDLKTITWQKYVRGKLLDSLNSLVGPAEPFVIIVFACGENVDLDADLIQLKILYQNAHIHCELGDEPQTAWYNVTRALISNTCSSPDNECVALWRSLGADCHWWTHWADEAVFYVDPEVQKLNVIRTTAVGRRYTKLLKFVFRNRFILKETRAFENTLFHQQALIVFQYARWSEVTRRIFEGSAAGACVLTNRLPRTKGLDTIFSNGVNIVLYRGAIDLVIKCALLLLFPNYARSIGAKAAKLVGENHSTKSRVHDLLKIISNCNDTEPRNWCISGENAKTSKIERVTFVFNLISRNIKLTLEPVPEISSLPVSFYYKISRLITRKYTSHDENYQNYRFILNDREGIYGKGTHVSTKFFVFSTPFNLESGFLTSKSQMDHDYLLDVVHLLKASYYRKVRMSVFNRTLKQKFSLFLRSARSFLVLINVTLKARG